MNIIRVVATKTNDPRDFMVCVQTRKGLRTNYFVNFPVNTTELSDLAYLELYVAWYCIINDRVFGTSCVGGQGVALYLSEQGAIDSISDKRIKSAGLSKFFRTKLHGLKVSLIEDVDAHFELDVGRIARIDHSYSYKSTIDTPVMGTIEISEHAYERYVQRFINKSEQAKIKSPWKTLSRSVSHSRIKEVKYSQSDSSLISKLKNLKNHESEQLKVFKDPLNDLHFVVTSPSSNKTPTLLTVFIRQEQHYIHYRKSNAS